MSNLKIQVVCAWVEELIQKNTISKRVGDGVLKCLEVGEDFGPLIGLSRQVGDPTPLEILAAGMLSNDDTYSYSGRSLRVEGWAASADRQ